VPLKKNSTLGFPVDSGRNQPDGGPTGRMAGAQRGWRTRSRKPRGGPASATGHAPRLALARTALQTTLRYSQCLSDIIKIRTRFRACFRFQSRSILNKGSLLPPLPILAKTLTVSAWVCFADASNLHSERRNNLPQQPPASWRRPKRKQASALHIGTSDLDVRLGES